MKVYYKLFLSNGLPHSRAGPSSLLRLYEVQASDVQGGRMTSTGQMMMHLDQPHRLADCLISQEKFPSPSESFRFIRGEGQKLTVVISLSPVSYPHTDLTSPLTLYIPTTGVRPIIPMEDPVRSLLPCHLRQSTQ